jgi:hypothetical protein
MRLDHRSHGPYNLCVIEINNKPQEQMGRSARKRNFLIASEICAEPEELAPPGKRSQVVNDALRKELEPIRRKRAMARLVTASSHGTGLSTEEIVEGLALDRRKH